MDSIHLELTPGEAALAALMAKEEHKSLDDFVSECVRTYLQRTPNAITLDTFAKTDAGLELTSHTSAQALFDKLDI